ncbi:adenylate/guanylate cyclase domain-containing protein [Nocardia sp. NPDC005825]|uniref:adenylate/guanylate cyclase domain-containing protein n=1 Tax=unclassified Nocardia TaxID=2637762 RepID=UPI0033D3A14C
MIESGEPAATVDPVVEHSLLGGPRRYTRTQVAEMSGVPLERARKLWVALGFPAAATDDEVAFTDNDVAAVRAFAELNPATVTSEQSQIAAARTVGQAMARLAEWQADLINREIEEQLAAAGQAVTPELRREATTRAVTVLSELQDYAWQRHMAAALSRTHESDGATRHLLVGFADMVGYTRLSRHLDPDELTELLEAFETTTTEVITAHGGWVIKNVGDEVMFAAEKPRDGARIALEMHTAIARVAQTISEMPQIRVGLAYGPVLTRFGDLYGTVVNVAARLTGVARPGTVLVDDGAAAELDGDDALALRHLRSVRVKGIPRLRSHVVRERKRR